jgi:catechol 2,3-dioxygenase-like lactoylglutathione lyase family enzyme
VEVIDSYPVVVTEKLIECRDFYRRWFGFEVGFEADWFVLMSGGVDGPTSLAFMHPEHPSSPPSPGAYRGDGAFITFQVADAAAEYERLREEGAEFELELTDPAGMWVDVIEQIEPAAGWWEPYMVGRE